MIDKSIWCEFDKDSDKWICKNTDGEVIDKVDFIHYRGHFEKKTPVQLLSTGQVNIQADDYPCKKKDWMGKEQLICKKR